MEVEEVTAATSGEQNGTTTGRDTTTTADQKPPNATKTDRINEPRTTTEQQKLEYLKLLHAKGGFILSCKTLVTLYGVVEGGEGGGEKGEWQLIDSGILSLVSCQHTLSLIFTSLNTGEITQEFEIERSINSPHSTTPSYTTHTPNFHSFVSSTSENKGTIIGVNFLNARTAEKFMKIVNKLTNSGPQPSLGEKNDENLPETKRARISTEGGGDKEPVVEEVDFAFPVVWRRKKQDDRIDPISDKGFFRRSLLEPAQEKPEPVESGTKRSSSFMEFTFQQPIPSGPIPVPPPVAPPSFTPSPSSSSHTLTSGSLASTFSGSSLEMPDPPKRDTSEQSLLYDISTFDRRKLHTVTEEEKLATHKGEEGGGGRIGELLYEGFKNMLPRIQAKYGIERTASISSSGDEEGFDDFDGLIFE